MAVIEIGDGRYTLRRFTRGMARTKCPGLAVLALFLCGCVVPVPPIVSYASLALDGVSLAFTRKSVSSHALSAATRKDCALWRVLKGEQVCRDLPSDERGKAIAASIEGEDVLAFGAGPGFRKRSTTRR